MKQLNSIPYKITSDILGVITMKGKNIFCRKDCVFVGHTKSTKRGYAATISNVELTGNGAGCTVKSIDDFSEGDVVMINTKGEIIFYYEIKSIHNAIFATERCNHRCVMCPQPPVLHEDDKTPFNMKLISLIDKDSKELGITGGEPTLIGDKLFELIRNIQKHQPKAAISLLSNGVKFADKEFAKKLANCRHRDLQIDIPIFSDIASEHNRIVGANTFYKTVQGLYNLALFRQRIGLRIVVHRLNYKRLPQLADYIYHNFPFVSQVAFLQMETVGNADTNLQDLWIDPYDYNEELKQAVLLLSNRGVCTYIYNAQLCVLPKEIREFAANSISDWKDTYLPECDNCKLREKCGGLFESNQKHHSSHIKPELPYTPQPMPNNIDLWEENASPFLRKNISLILKHVPKDSVVYDIPSGYGRNAIWLTTQGYSVSCVDIDVQTLNYLNDYIIKNNLSEKIHLQNANIMNLELNKCRLLLNVHLYSKEIIQKLSGLIESQGIFIVETPQLRGGNFKDLPQANELKDLLASDFDFLVYDEIVNERGYASVNLIAKKK